MVKSYRFKFPNFRIGPCGISSAYRAHFPPLIVRARVRIIPCGFRSIWCGNSAVNGAEIPHDRCISAAYHAISAGHSALPHVAVRKFRTVQFGNLHLYEITMITVMIGMITMMITMITVMITQRCKKVRPVRPIFV